MNIFKKSKKTLMVRYDTLQSRTGGVKPSDKPYVINFKHIEVIGNNLLLYISDNGFSDKGRLGGIYDLSEYKIIFE